MYKENEMIKPYKGYENHMASQLANKTEKDLVAAKKQGEELMRCI